MEDSKGEHDQAKKLSFKAVLPKSESFSELSWHYSWLPCFCSLDDLRPPGPCQALCCFHGLDPPDFWKQLVFITCLTKTRTCYNTNILKNPLTQRYLSDSKNFVEEGKKRERCGAKLCFLQKEQLYRYEAIYISSICFISPGNSAEIL